MSAQTIAWQDSIHLPLGDCYLCTEADCNTVTDNAIRCPCCGSEHGLLSLGNVLDRPDAASRLAGVSAAVDALEAVFEPEIDHLEGCK